LPIKVLVVLRPRLGLQHTGTDHVLHLHLQAGAEILAETVGQLLAEFDGLSRLTSLLLRLLPAQERVGGLQCNQLAVCIEHSLGPGAEIPGMLHALRARTDQEGRHLGKHGSRPVVRVAHTLEHLGGVNV